MAAAFFGLLQLLWGGALAAPRCVGRKSAEQSAPVLCGITPHGALRWSDALLVNPEGFVATLVERARAGGVDIHEQVSVERLSAGDGSVQLLQRGIALCSAKVVVSTLGPWMRDLACEWVAPEARLTTRWCKAFNLVVRKQVDATHAIGVEGRERRLFFAVPRGTESALGTWYEPCSEEFKFPDSSSPEVSVEEIERFITEFNHALPTHGIRAADVTATEVGILPMKEISDGQPVLYGGAQIRAHPRFIELLSTKYTTFRSQAHTVLKLAKGFL